MGIKSRAVERITPKDGVNLGLDTLEKGTSALEESTEEFSRDAASYKDKSLKGEREHLRDSEGRSRGPNVCLLGVPAKENADHDGEEKSEELRVERFPHLKKIRVLR